MAFDPKDVSSLWRPRFVARVGVTGHRRNNAAYEAAKLDDVIGETLQQVDRAIRAAHKEHAACYSDEAPLIRMISGLADGADQSAANARPSAWGLDAILPKPVAEYRRDLILADRPNDAGIMTFDTLLQEAEAVLELAASLTGDRDASCYARQGRTLVQQTDLLVAVWDGKQSRGAGGTAEVIARAMDERLPVVCVSLTGGEPALLSDDSSAAAGLSRLPALLCETFRLYDVHETEMHDIAVADRPFQAANAEQGWTDLLSQFNDTGPFADRLRSAVTPLLRSADRGIVEAVRLAILLLPIVGLSRTVARDRASGYVLHCLNALSREVGLPSARLDAGYVAAHCERVAKMVVQQCDVQEMLCRVGHDVPFDEVCSLLTAIALPLSNLRGPGSRQPAARC